MTSSPRAGSRTSSDAYALCTGSGITGGSDPGSDLGVRWKLWSRVGGRPLQVWAPEPCRRPACRTFLVHGALAAGGGGPAFPCQSECLVRIKPRL